MSKCPNSMAFGSTLLGLAVIVVVSAVALELMVLEDVKCKIVNIIYLFVKLRCESVVMEENDREVEHMAEMRSKRWCLGLLWS